MSELFLGMISGTSVDGVDAVVAEFGDRSCRIVAANTYPYPDSLRMRLDTLIRNPAISLADLGSLDIACGRFFADAALASIDEIGCQAEDITAIGHHGQTVFHAPTGPEPFTMQLGNAATVAARTGIATVGHIRDLDMALDGEGAPMVPAFHKWLFADKQAARVVANIGGIGNITTLPGHGAVVGFDTGPGNTLLDLWIDRCRGEKYDADGAWAGTGKVVPQLLDALLDEAYFSAPPPKSTGRELFNEEWLNTRLAAAGSHCPAADVQRTLLELTAVTLTRSVTEQKLSNAELLVCGGGAHNSQLMDRISQLHTGPVNSTSSAGLHPDWVEAAAFAWLARARLRKEPGNVPTVTGARQEAVLGGLYCGRI